jgi:hypothetical protein
MISNLSHRPHPAIIYQSIRQYKLSLKPKQLGGLKRTLCGATL